VLDHLLEQRVDGCEVVGHLSLDRAIGTAQQSLESRADPPRRVSALEGRSP
jgi:hypothetical protein